jgi:hypothetical protein
LVNLFRAIAARFGFGVSPVARKCFVVKVIQRPELGQYSFSGGD